MQSLPIILASRSPRRIALLHEIGLPFEVCPSNAEESNAQGDSPRAIAIHAAQLKADEVAQRQASRLVLGADTIVCLGERVLGKPRDRSEARDMLRALRGRWHTVVTGLCLIAAGETPWTAAETTRVHISDFSDEEMERYIATDEPLDKAGAYAIQGSAVRFVEEIDGDYHNVVGLPLALLLRGLSRFISVEGITVPPPPDRFRNPPA
ncbi:septum formation protein Maf [Candidatus Sumerlaeota bacterium]|nr:septum formation protein Maf [Candidatus Sumerlaeota bacterium]